MLPRGKRLRWRTSWLLSCEELGYEGMKEVKM